MNIRVRANADIETVRLCKGRDQGTAVFEAISVRLEFGVAFGRISAQCHDISNSCIRKFIGRIHNVVFGRAHACEVGRNTLA